MIDWQWFEASIIGVLLLVFAFEKAALTVKRLFYRDPTSSTHFSPRGGCTSAVVAELAAARREIFLMAYSFTSKTIAAALIAAAKRRVRVIVILDRSNERETYSELGDLAEHKVEVLIDANHAIAHNKVIVIDRRVVVTGSFNFTNQAENENAENLLILRDHGDLADRYRTNFLSHRDHCHQPGQAPPAHPHTYRR